MRFATILMLLYFVLPIHGEDLTLPKPLPLPMPINIWHERTYQQKVDFVRDTLYHINAVSQLPEYILITDKELATHKISPESMVMRIDCFYITYPNSYRVPAWLAMLYQEQKIDSWIIENIMERLWNEQATDWVE